MDENKRAKLIDIGYHIRPCCAMCRHAEFKPTQAWGGCQLHEYTHLKHSGPDKKLSIHLLGFCSGFERDEQALATLGNYQEFWGFFRRLGM
jgi:hypothetical protein